MFWAVMVVVEMEGELIGFSVDWIRSRWEKKACRLTKTCLLARVTRWVEMLFPEMGSSGEGGAGKENKDLTPLRCCAGVNQHSSVTKSIPHVYSRGGKLASSFLFVVFSHRMVICILILAEGGNEWKDDTSFR